MFNNRQFDYSADAAIRDANNSISAADNAIREVNQLIGKQQPVKEYFVNSSPSKGGTMNPLDYTTPGIAINAIKNVMGGGTQQQGQGDDFDNRLNQELQKARGVRGAEEYAKGLENVARFRAQGMGGAMQGSELANQAMGQEGQLRNNQEYQMAQAQKAAEWATNKARDVQRDQSNQKFAQDVGLENLRQGYTQEQNIRQTKADQAKDLLKSYVDGRQAAMNFAQQSFRSLI